jgi:hypothetical protein
MSCLPLAQPATHGRSRDPSADARLASCGRADVLLSLISGSGPGWLSRPTGGCPAHLPDGSTGLASLREWKPSRSLTSTWSRWTTATTTARPFVAGWSVILFPQAFASHVCRPTCTPEELSEGGLPASSHRAEPCPLSVLAGELTMAEAARREKVSEQSIGRGRPTSWRRARPRSRPEGPVPQPGRKSLRLRSRT